ncbi:hypothetical protein VCR15J2_460085 [Vibrio coralliirubri]|nr:hypothetical protein VCR15J2_460085 [Vibrio coralliirubri]
MAIWLLNYLATATTTKYTLKTRPLDDWSNLTYSTAHERKNE